MTTGQAIQATLTVLIAMIATFIAYQQWQTNRVKLRLDRYDRRLAIFREVARFLHAAISGREVVASELFAFRAAVAETPFLFGPDVVKYVDEITQRAMTLFVARAKYARDDSRGTDYNEAAAWQYMVNDEHYKWLEAQVGELVPRFQPYLDLND